MSDAGPLQISAPLKVRLIPLPSALLDAPQKLVDSALQFIGPIDLKIQFGRTAQTQTLGEFMPHVVLRGGQTFQSTLGLSLIPGNVDHDASRTRVLGHDHRTDPGQADARITQFAFEDGFNLLANGLAQPSAMIFPPTLLQGIPRMEKTRKNIRKLR